MCRIRSMVKCLSLPILLAGLFLTCFLDFALYRNHGQMDVEVFTPYAIHRLEGIDGLVQWWDVITSLMTSKLQENPEAYMEDPAEARMMMTMDPMIRSIQLLPRNGKPVAFLAEDTREIDFPWLLQNSLRKAAEEARQEDRLVLVDSVDVGAPYKMMVLLRPVFIHSEEQTRFWGYIALSVEQSKVLSRANISNLGKQRLDYTLYHKNGWDDKPHLVKELGKTEMGNPYAERVIAGDLWTIVLRPQGSGVNWMLLFFATLAGLSLTILISFLFRRNGILKKANGALKRSGGHDPLTGVYNRKGGDDAVASYMAENPGKKALVIALDIDNFKLVNDVYGHRVGDEALKTLVRDMKETFGEKSIITRNGGDEFVLFHPYEDFTKVTGAMDRFTRKPHTFKTGDKEVKFYASLGCAAYPEQGEAYGDLCIRADFALYGAKLNGKAGWRQFDNSISLTDKRSQFGFNLTDVADHLPGGILVLKATEKEEILFANHGMVSLLECDDYEDFMKYTGGSIYNVIHPGDVEPMKREFQRQLSRKDNKEHIDFLTYRMVTKKGHIIEVEDTARKSTNPFYGDLYYIYLNNRKDRLKLTEKE
ncbi:diguanylate cyclase [uncultured Dialister sp.]|uniref:diguanylate cyclase n=2 Tax=uncultured Dialister sp. TaxID=278064 RepID=UPI0026310C16|nr:diguanylate cyclase [uncultured Dialister sp.]